jgi:MFS family permease
MNNDVRQRTSIHYAWVILGLVVASVFASLGLGRFGYTAILPAMQEGLRLSNAQTGELQSWNLFGYLLTVVGAGVLASRFGPRWVITASLLLTGGAMLLTGLVPTFEGARWGRFLTGVGGAGSNVPAMALLAAWFGPRRRGLAAGIGVAGSSVGLVVTGPMVPAIIEAYKPEGWRVAWFILGLLACGVSALCAVALRNRPQDLGATPLGGDANPQPALSGSDQGLSGGIAVYRSGTLWHLAAVYFGFGLSYIMFSTFFIRYLTKELGFTQTEAGWLWLKIGMLSGVSGFIWGLISDRWGRRLALIGVFLLQGTGFVVLGTYPKPAGAYVTAILFALTAWSIPALMAALAGDLFGARLAPTALGLMTIVFGVGQALGPYLAGQIADAASSFRPAFLLAGVIALSLGVGGSSYLPRNTRNATANGA